MGYVGQKMAGRFSTEPVHHACRAMADKGGGRLHDLAYRETPIGDPRKDHDFAHLRKSWHADIVVIGVDGRGRVTYTKSVYNDAEYAWFIEHGWGLWGPRHAKYEILPKHPGGWLVFRSRITGELVFTKRVMHPGAPGQHMMLTAASKTAFELHTGVLLAEELMEWRVQQAAAFRLGRAA